MSKKFLKNLKYGIAAIFDVLLRVTASFLGLTKETDLKQPLSENAKVLFVSLDHLGDAVMATPAIEALKATFPASRLTILIRPQNAAVFAQNPYVDEVLTDDAPWWSDHPIKATLRPGYLARLRRAIAHLRREGYEVVIDLRGDLRHLLLFGAAVRPRILLAYACTGGASLLSSQIPCEPQMHEIKKKLALLTPLGVNGLNPKPRIWVLPEEMEDARQRIRFCLGDARPLIILLDPGAKPVQRWPLDRFSQVARAISKDIGKPVLVSAGPAYVTLARDLVQIAGSKAACLLSDLDLRELIALIAACDLVVSCDTGIAHIAGAVGTPAVTLFGPTAPQRFWFGAKGARILPSPVFCCNHDLHESCEVPGHVTPGACMMAITPEMVLEVISQTLKEVLSLGQTGA